MKLLSVSTLALALVCGAQAQDTSRDDELVTAVTGEDMQYLIESGGYTVKEPLTTGLGFIGETEEELLFGVRGKACDDEEESCVGVESFVILSGYYTAEDANSINQRWSAIKATALDDADLMLSRYMILDHGQTLQNVRLSLHTTVLIAEKIQAENQAEDAEANGETAEPVILTSDQIAWGDNKGDYANDDACDDARFHEDGDDWSYQREHVLHDAADCRTLYEAGEITLFLDFGDNSGEYADDNTCDDNRFTGEGRSILLTDSHIKKDSDDCIAAYRDNRLNRP